MQWPGWILQLILQMAHGYLMDVFYLCSFLSMSCRHGCHLLRRELVLPIDAMNNFHLFHLPDMIMAAFFCSVQLTPKKFASSNGAGRFVFPSKVSATKRKRAV